MTEEKITFPSDLEEPLSLTQEESASVPLVQDSELAFGQEHTPPDSEHVVLCIGGGHMSQEVVKLAAYAGFTVDVLDMREEYALPERFPQARHVQLCADYGALDQEYPLESRNYAVVLTHSFETDCHVLTQLLESPVRYIGVTGSDRKKENMMGQLRAKGFPDAELACIRCPIGLAIGAESPQEVAIAIVAELIATRTGCLPRYQTRRAG